MRARSRTRALAGQLRSCLTPTPHHSSVNPLHPSCLFPPPTSRDGVDSTTLDWVHGLQPDDLEKFYAEKKEQRMRVLCLDLEPTGIPQQVHVRVWRLVYVSLCVALCGCVLHQVDSKQSVHTRHAIDFCIFLSMVVLARFGSVWFGVVPISQFFSHTSFHFSLPWISCPRAQTMIESVLSHGNRVGYGLDMPSAHGPHSFNTFSTGTYHRWLPPLQVRVVGFYSTTE